MTQHRCLVPGLMALLACSLPLSLFAQPSTTISAGSATVAVGDTFNIPVSISGVTDLFDWEFDLAFDPTLLQLQNVTEGPFLSSAGSTNFFPGITDNTTGKVTFVLDSLSGNIPGANGSGTLANLSFQAIGVGVSSLDLSGVILQDSTAADIPFGISDGSVTVSPASSVPEPRTWTWIAPLLAVIMLFRRVTA